MSVTSLTVRGVFPGDVREMKNQEQNYNPYGDDESPIDLSKKATISKRKQPESINDKHYQEEYIRGESPALSEEENEKRCEFFHAIQKMSALALPPFLHPWLMVSHKDLARMSGSRIGLPSNAGSGYQAYGGPNPCILNPLSLASLYPLVSEQCGVPYSMVHYSNGSHTQSQMSRTTSDATKLTNKKEKTWYCEQREYSKDWSTSTELHRDSRVNDPPEKETGFREGNNCHLEEDGNAHNRCASTPPDAECKNRQKILSIRHLRDSWKSDSKLLASRATKSHNKSKSRFASDGSLDHAILRLHFAKNKRSGNLTEKDCTPPSSFAAPNIRRSHSCSDLSQFKHCASKKISTRHSRYHSGYASDNETLYSSPFFSSQSSLYSAGSKKESSTDLGSAYKRKSYAPSDDSDVESEKSLLSVGSESPPGKKTFQDAKRLKSLRSLSEPSIRKKVVAPPNGDHATPTDLSTKSSVPLGKNPDAFLQQFSHSPQTEIPWRVYGYYNHLLQRFREEEILKRHSSYHSRDHHKEQYPIGSEAGLSPPPSPSPENYSPLTSAGTWMESSRSGDYGRDESPDSSILPSDPNNRKRPCRALTGKHVKHGTGASPSTLITLRQKIQERQKAKELGIAFDKGENEAVKSKTGQNKKSYHSRSNSNKRDRSKQGTKFLPSTSLQSKDQNV